MRSKVGNKNHKFEINSSESDKCSVCGVYRIKKYLVIGGFLTKKSYSLYSKDGVSYDKDFINCTK